MALWTWGRAIVTKAVPPRDSYSKLSRLGLTTDRRELSHTQAGMSGFHASGGNDFGQKATDYTDKLRSGVTGAPDRNPQLAFYVRQHEIVEK